MSQPAKPTLANMKETFDLDVPNRISLAMASIAPAPTQTPFTAAITGCGQFLIALTKSPVILVKSQQLFHTHLR